MALSTFLKNKKIFVTGHTGFKGSWLCHLLNHHGANITGFSLPPSEMSHFRSCKTEKLVDHIIGNINDYSNLELIMCSVDPDIVIHMAAQPLVRLSYDLPLETMQTNILGTANVLAAAQKCHKKPIVACITSDKCYENVESDVPYEETDRLGGHDPYSASKGAAELVAASFAKSFYIPANQTLLTLRGGNVIGGGDWSTDRVMTDIIRALSDESPPVLRNPNAIRPWQHVLDVLNGYLHAIENVAIKPGACFDSFNIGPEPGNEANVGKLAKLACEIWGNGISPEIVDKTQNLHEAKLLRLNVSKAAKLLNWKSKYGFETTVLKTIEWYRAELVGECMAKYTEQQILEYFYGD